MTAKSTTKKEQIIKTAMQLFAVKGSSSTSMQEIAELCGISKGSLYLIFKSKEELERSIYIYCFRMIHDPLQREEQETGRAPREKLRNQLEILLSHVYELREFLQRQFQEVAGRGITETPDWVAQNNAALLRWFQHKLELMYGPEILPYAGDLCLLSHGMIHASIKLLFGGEASVSIPDLADRLVDWLDILVSGLLAGQPAPLISSAVLAAWAEGYGENPRQSPLQLIKAMKLLLSEADGSHHEHAEDGLESLNILESEILTSHPRKAILQGMIANLQGYPVLSVELSQLKKQFAPFMQTSCGLHE
ncbi:TetR/AcrR family transcriptional regulator [Paenibacillus tritici]|uniref:TetR/AcrR family transcriptional regulator n=1 Tax=Paenibacillus tritici TaxID=1873425 RepID=UPI001BA5C8FD|nr:TetR/AcrR family transcriptional regulator [Paenibacillus tritici]QUL54618.1 TetR/AcrR family transcriptional regulator [Paenibacillus tritici]